MGRKIAMNTEHITQNTQKGQIFIIVLLTLLVISVIVLAVSSRSITDISISRTSEESARAFSAAEAGVEEAVEKIRSETVVLDADIGPITLTNKAAVTYKVSKQGASLQAFLSPTQLTPDIETFQVYLADYLADPNLLQDNFKGSLCLLWGDPGASETPAIEATVVYKNMSNKIVNQRFAIDGQSPARAGFQLKEEPSCASEKTSLALNNNLGIDRTFAHAHRLHLNPGSLPDIENCGGGTKCVQLLRLRLLFNNTTPQYIGVVSDNAGNALPPQGYKIESTGSVPEGGTKRKVQVFRSFPSLPTVFDFVLFNGLGPLSK